MFYGTFSTNRLYHAIEVGNVSHRAGGEHKHRAIKQGKNTINTIMRTLRPGLYGDDPLATVRPPQRGLSSQSLDLLLLLLLLLFTFIVYMCFILYFVYDFNNNLIIIALNTDYLSS